VEQKQKIYWWCQVTGWVLYFIINLLFFGLSNQTSFRDIVVYFFFIVLGISLTHVYRYLILKFKILGINILYQLIFIIISSAVLSAIFFTIGFSFRITQLTIENIFNGIVPFTFWSLIYFGFHYLQNYKRTEIQNLRWEAASKDIELNKLKSQLNPHFMFNSMNSIRALIDENPVKAKNAVTQLSNILRNTLLMNKSKEIMLEEELKIVKDYLDLEKIRYEERLNYDFTIEDETLKKSVPPLIVQTQVENAIKHGISKLPKGGRVQVVSRIEDRQLIIEILNSGQVSTEKTETGFGLLNSKQRLDLLYGSKAGIEIKNTGSNEVQVKIKIPLP
jgi:two-component system LytT family sensor kinase